MLKKLLIPLLLLPLPCWSDVIVVTVCDDPAMFILLEKNETLIIPVDHAGKYADRILKEMEKGKAQVFEAERHSKEAICGTLF